MLAAGKLPCAMAEQEAVGFERAGAALQRQAKAQWLQRDRAVNAIATREFGIDIPAHKNFRDDEGGRWVISVHANLTYLGPDEGEGE